jgi:hypothetical protein
MLTMQKTNERSNITLSLDSHVLEEVRKNAGAQNTSVNALINDVLSKHVFFYKYMAEQKSVVIPSRIYSSMVKTLDEEKQIELMKRVSLEIIPSIFTHHNISFTISNLIKYCFEGIGLWAGMYSTFSYHTDEKNHLCLVFEHHYGTKWSRIIAESISNFIENSLSCSTEQKILQNIVVIKVLDKR